MCFPGNNNPYCEKSSLSKDCISVNRLCYVIATSPWFDMIMESINGLDYSQCVVRPY